MSTRRLRDSRSSSVIRPAIDLRTAPSNFKSLERGSAAAHLGMLGDRLKVLSTLLHRGLPDIGQPNEYFSAYLGRLIDTLDTIVLKDRIESMKPNSDVALTCSIDPSDSGFPIFVRDFKFLLGDLELAEQSLGALPSDEKLVDRALFTLFRGLYPSDVVLDKLERDYYTRLSGLELPSSHRLLIPDSHDLEQDGMQYFKLSVERLDPHRNIPRFYTLYLKYPASNNPDKLGAAFWAGRLRPAIEEGFATLSDMELPYLAKLIDAIGVVRLEMIERFDIGPFYNRHTDNHGEFGELLEAPEDGDFLLFFRRHMLQREGDRRPASLWQRATDWYSGKAGAGRFTPVVSSPKFALLPHRLIQRAHIENIDIGDHVLMYGTTPRGELID